MTAEEARIGVRVRIEARNPSLYYGWRGTIVEAAPDGSFAVDIPGLPPDPIFPEVRTTIRYFFPMGVDEGRGTGGLARRI